MGLKTNKSRTGAAQDGAAAGAALDKAQLRRAQVRKAQTQHRQRKANYVKQLEMDVARIRDMMEAAERDTRAMLDENKLMRTRIQQAITSKAVPLSLDQRVSILREMPEPAQLSGATTENLPAPQEPEPAPVTVTLGFDEALNAPAFYISSPPPTAVPSQQSSTEPSPKPAGDDGALPELTPAQTHAAINFILALVFSFSISPYAPCHLVHSLPLPPSIMVPSHPDSPLMPISPCPLVPPMTPLTATTRP